ncbi:helix-turn-helix transcriptional regulator [Leucobacter chromiiresistens]|uniref:Proteasome accessory factor B n=1 Tax=Leucobacter chromiiresistens TaxID=1079994 RepID=A0A1H0ZRH6_9MICO|nr:WYL domain-containing protein [Leucobacter chromiiresistens]SDQ29979.1 proteasome accessory factor B [Leucobacter chromiiresistens]
MPSSSASSDAPAKAPRSSVPSEQRLFSLVLALVVSPFGATKRELLSSVYGYADRYRHGPISPALEKQFERDKDQLRSLGIQIEAFDDPQDAGNNQLTRYRISKERLQFPADLRFSERELMLLRLAALAWSEGSLSAESRRAAMKLEALGAGLDVQHLGIAPRLGTAEAAAAPLQRAIDAGRAVRFAYRLPDRPEPLLRRVAPLRLHRAEGRWHLISWDLERDAARTFLLARIEGRVQQLAEEFAPELRLRIDAAVAELERLRSERRAVLCVRRGSIAEARLASRASGSPGGARCGAEDHREIEVGVLDPHIFAAELIGYGADVSVCEPERLRDIVVAGLRRIAEVHRPRRGADADAIATADEGTDDEGTADNGTAAGRGGASGA